MCLGLSCSILAGPSHDSNSYKLFPNLFPFPRKVQSDIAPHLVAYVVISTLHDTLSSSFFSSKSSWYPINFLKNLASTPHWSLHIPFSSRKEKCNKHMPKFPKIEKRRSNKTMLKNEHVTGLGWDVSKDQGRPIVHSMTIDRTVRGFNFTSIKNVCNLKLSPDLLYVSNLMFATKKSTCSYINYINFRVLASYIIMSRHFSSFISLISEFQYRLLNNTLYCLGN